MRRFLAVMLACALCILPARALGGVTFYEDSYVGGVCAFKGDMYLLRYEGLFKYDTASGEETLVSGDVSNHWDTWGTDASVDIILADAGGLYGYSESRNCLVLLINAEGEFVNEIALTPGEGALLDISLTAVQNGRFIYAGADEQTLCVTDIANAQRAKFEAENIAYICAYEANQIIAARKIDDHTEISLFDFTSGVESEWGRTTLDIDALAWNEAARELWATDGSQFYLWTGEDFEPRAYAITGYVSGMAAWGEYVAAVVDGALVTRALNAEGDAFTLSILQKYGKGWLYSGYLNAYPDARLNFISGDGAPEERFVRDMVNRSGDIDIYVLSDISLIAPLSEKQYGADMTQNATLNALYNDMYAPFKNLFAQGCAARAFPLELYVLSMGYYPEFFEKYNLEAPRTYMQLLELCEYWLDECADDAPEAYFNPFHNDFTVEKILARYSDECARNGRQLEYDAPELVQTLEKYSEVSARFDEYFESKRYIFKEHAFNVLDMPQMGNCAPLALTFREGDLPAIGGADLDVTYFVINPFSAQIDKALDFVAESALMWTDSARVVLYASCAKPVKSSPETQEWETWDIEPAEIEGYLEAVKYMEFCAPNPFFALNTEGDTLLEQFAQGALPANRFLERIDAVVRMAFAEGGAW